MSNPLTILNGNIITNINQELFDGNTDLNITVRPKPGPYYILNQYSRDWDFDLELAKKYFINIIEEKLKEFFAYIIDVGNLKSEIYEQKYQEALKVTIGNYNDFEIPLLSKEAFFRNISVLELSESVINNYNTLKSKKQNIELLRMEFKLSINNCKTDTEMKYLVSTLNMRLQNI